MGSHQERCSNFFEMHQGKDKEAKEDAAEAEPPAEAAPPPMALVPKPSPTELLRQAAAKRAAGFVKVHPCNFVA